MKNKLEKLFKPNSIAVVGATEKDGKVGNVIAKNILHLGFEGEVFLVNPKYDELFGKKSYKNLQDIKKKVEMAIIIVPAKFVNQIIEESKDRIKNFVIISAGFSETNKEGKKREAELFEIAKKNKLNILGPNCLGFIIPKIKLNASFAGGLPEEGGVSLISQSGALAVAMLDIAKQEQFKFSQIISVGNKMQIGESQLIEYLGNDEQTKLVAIYIEGIKNGKDFIDASSKVSIKKPIVILKAGRSEKARKAIASHTGALAGSDKIMDVAFEKSGVLRADNLAEFFNLIKFITTFKDIENFKTVIITNAGGPGVLATDNFQGKFVQLAELSDKLKKALSGFLPSEASVENPIDLLGDADEVRYEKTLEILNEEKNIGNVLCLLTAQDQTPVEKIAQVIVDFSQNSSQNIIPVFIGGKKIQKGLEILKSNNISNFSFPKEAIDVLDKLANHKKRIEEIKVKNKKSEELRDFQNNKVIKESSKILTFAKKDERIALFFEEANKIMKMYDIPIIKFTNLTAKKKTFFLDKKYQEGFPAVVKVDSDKILHKTDRQALILGIKDSKELKIAIKKMRKEFPIENLIVQPMLESEVELILGMKKDSIFGTVIVFGLGGIYAEVFKMVDFMLLPLTRNEIKKILKASKINFLFEETRGRVVINIDDMTNLIFNFARLVGDLEQIKEIDINPLLISNGKPVAVDIKILI